MQISVDDRDHRQHRVTSTCRVTVEFSLYKNIMKRCDIFVRLSFALLESALLADSHISRASCHFDRPSSAFLMAEGFLSCGIPVGKEPIQVVPEWFNLASFDFKSLRQFREALNNDSPKVQGPDWNLPGKLQQFFPSLRSCALSW